MERILQKILRPIVFSAVVLNAQTFHEGNTHVVELGNQRQLRTTLFCPPDNPHVEVVWRGRALNIGEESQMTIQNNETGELFYLNFPPNIYPELPMDRTDSTRINLPEGDYIRTVGQNVHRLTSVCVPPWVGTDD
jgi:hypothetical protein